MTKAKSVFYKGNHQGRLLETNSLPFLFAPRNGSSPGLKTFVAKAGAFLLTKQRGDDDMFYFRKEMKIVPTEFKTNPDKERDYAKIYEQGEGEVCLYV